MEFSTLADFRKQYNSLRDDILARHGYKPGDKVRLNRVIVMYQKFNGQWVKTTNLKTDMEDRIRKYEGRGIFQLKALV